MPSVVVVGAGTMGSGIAQVAAQSGWNVRVMDVNPDAVAKAIAGIQRGLDRLVEKGKLGATLRDQILSRISAGGSPADVRGCDLIIEAVVEDLEVKGQVLTPLALAASGAIIASNTSSLSINGLAERIRSGVHNDPSHAEADDADIAARVVGMHFFNPVPLMPLVEIIAGQQSDPAVVQHAFDIARAWGKTAVRVKDTPGFIVNRVARGYYLESLRMLGEGVAGVDEIDQTLKTLGGFRMGPFELMDLIGIDVNYAVSSSVWQQMGRPERLTPHPIQAQLVERQQLGRKTKIGFYSYHSEHPVPAVPVARRSFDLPAKLYAAVRRFADAAAAARPQAGENSAAEGSITEQYILSRVLIAIINEATLAQEEGVASAEDIDTAMKLGTNYPLGPLEWADHIGRHTCAALLRLKINAIGA